MIIAGYLSICPKMNLLGVHSRQHTHSTFYLLIRQQSSVSEQIRVAMPQSFGIESLFRARTSQHLGQCRWSRLSAFCHDAPFRSLSPQSMGRTLTWYTGEFLGASHRLFEM